MLIVAQASMVAISDIGGVVLAHTRGKLDELFEFCWYIFVHFGASCECGRNGWYP